MSSDLARGVPGDFSDVVQLVQGWVGHGFYPGAGLVIGSGSRILIEQYFGVHDSRTEEFIASAGKWLAAAVIAAVVEQGGLSWDDRACQWLPEFVGEAGEVTLRQLLSHTSGFAEQMPRGQPDDDYQTLEESVAHIAKLPMRDRPGTRFRYGGLAMQ